jgi:hypothetical protein
VPPSQHFASVNSISENYSFDSAIVQRAPGLEMRYEIVPPSGVFANCIHKGWARFLETNEHVLCELPSSTHLQREELISHKFTSLLEGGQSPEGRRGGVQRVICTWVGDRKGMPPQEERGQGLTQAPFGLQYLFQGWAHWGAHCFPSGVGVLW